MLHSSGGQERANLVFGELSAHLAPHETDALFAVFFGRHLVVSDALDKLFKSAGFSHEPLYHSGLRFRPKSAFQATRSTP